MKFSIVVPIYNVEKYIDLCVKSLINQTYSNLEIILVNDGSTDNCAQLCDSYAKMDNRICVIHKENGGLSDARNFGIGAATGEYIIFVDSDDYIETFACAELYKKIEKCDQKPDVIVGGLVKRDGKSNKVFVHSYISDECISGPDFILNELRCKSMKTPAVLNICRAKFLNENYLRFKKGLLHEDEEFTPRLFLHAKQVLSTNIVFYNHMIREGSITTQEDKIPNARSIARICHELEPLYNQIENDELQNLLLDYTVNIYYKAFFDAQLYKKEFNSFLDIDFFKRNSKSIKNILRTILLCCNKRVLYNCHQIRCKIETNMR